MYVSVCLPALTQLCQLQIIYIKKKIIDYKNIERIAKLIPQNLVFALQFEEEIQLAVFCERMFTTAWIPEAQVQLELQGLTFDEVWENIIKKIEGGEWDSNLSLSENIELKEKKEKLQREIAKLEKLARKEIQPKKKFELVSQKRNLEDELNGL